MNQHIVTTFAIVAQSAKISFADAQRIARNCDLQMSQDYFYKWYRRAKVIAVETLELIPLGAVPVIITDQLDQPDALGFHSDENGQPICYVLAQDLAATCITCSHEICEALTDPHGNRLIVAPVNGTPCRVLCEVCDPSEASSYTPHGGDLPVSDFYLPEWFDAVPQRFTEYSFTGALLRPGQVIAGGYMSYIGPDNKWYQITYWGDAPQTDGPFDWQRKPGESLREMIDRETRARRPAQA